MSTGEDSLSSTEAEEEEEENIITQTALGHRIHSATHHADASTGSDHTSRLTTSTADSSDVDLDSDLLSLSSLSESASLSLSVSDVASHTAGARSDHEQPQDEEEQEQEPGESVHFEEGSSPESPSSARRSRSRRKRGSSGKHHRASESSSSSAQMLASSASSVSSSSRRHRSTSSRTTTLHDLSRSPRTVLNQDLWESFQFIPLSPRVNRFTLLFDAFHGLEKAHPVNARYQDLEGSFDVLVVPKPSSFGSSIASSASGLCRSVFEYFGVALAFKHDQYIESEFSGEQPIGHCFLLSTHHNKYRYVAFVSVRRSIAEGTAANDLNEYNALRSTLLAIRRHNQKYILRKPHKLISTCVCPSFPVVPTRSIAQCIQQMQLAFENTVLKKPMPVALPLTDQQAQLITPDELQVTMEAGQLEERGLANRHEVQILIDWVKAGAEFVFDTKKNTTTEREAFASRALLAACSLVRQVHSRSGKEKAFLGSGLFRVREMLVDPDQGCLAEIIRLASAGKIAVHRHIELADLQCNWKTIIGRGSSAIVYEGTWNSETVAIKVLQDYTETAVEDFRREVALNTLVEFPCLVQCHGANFERHDKLYSVLTLARRGDLFTVLHDQDELLDWNLRLRLAITAAIGINQLHAIGVIHRDLKSKNIFVSEDHTSLLADFGNSRLADVTGQMTYQVGTASWTAPEILMKQPYSFAADVYSFGIVLWEIATRQLPYDDLALGDLLLIAKGKKRPPLTSSTQQQHNIPEGYRALVQSCWNSQPEKRPSVRHVIEELEAIRKSLNLPLLVEKEPVVRPLGARVIHVSQDFVGVHLQQQQQQQQQQRERQRQRQREHLPFEQPPRSGEADANENIDADSHESRQRDDERRRHHQRSSSSSRRRTRRTRLSSSAAPRHTASTSSIPFAELPVDARPQLRTASSSKEVSRRSARPKPIYRDAAGNEIIRKRSERNAVPHTMSSIH